MLEIIGAEPLLRNTASAGRLGYQPQSDDRPRTRFENRGLTLGHGVWHMVCERI
jgi:tRNA (guanine-N7-)-methyltransferase